MNADRWKQIEDCYHAAMERPVPERAAFLAQACGNDLELRREVESLLAHEGQADELLESPAWNQITPSDETGTFAPGALAAGAMIAEYRIAGKLGSGGMGEVYRATDAKLQREVALKVLAPGFAQNAAWMSRFQREARVLASLNHPHIAAVYGLEESGGVRAIAMELVEGPTLAERMARGCVPIPEALGIARQIAEALEYAHEKGIVHRDLKPANVKLRPDGVVKVLDFGLAKSVDSKEAPAVTATRAGVIMGTPAYMAPEQAAGLPVDKRADIWAFGVVLFEMLAGRQIYVRKTTPETLAAVARDEPKWDELPAETPTAIVRLLHRCLDKDARRRLRDMGEARILLEEDQTEIAIQPRRPWLAWIAAVVLGVAAAAGWILFFRTAAGRSGVDWKVSVVPPPGVELPSVGSIFQATPEISPDGTTIVCRLGEGLQLRRLNSIQFVPLKGTKDALQPFWSPDSQWIAFFVNGALMKLKVPDGAPELLLQASGNPTGGTWGSKGTILFGLGGSKNGIVLRAIPDTGGTATELEMPRPVFGGIFPHFLPDGEHFLFTAVSRPSSEAVAVENFYLGGWRGGKWTLPPVALSAKIGEIRYSPAFGGSALFVSNDNLYAQRLNLAQSRLEGNPILVEASVASSTSVIHTASFSASANGLLAWRAGQEYAEQLTWFDRHGNAVATAGPPSDYVLARLSPDERRIAAIVNTGAGAELRVLEAGQGGFLAISTPNKTPDVYGAIWRRDSLHLLYIWPKSGGFNLTEQSAIGSPEVRDLGKVTESRLYDITPDGTLLLMGRAATALNLVPLEGDRTPRPLLASDEETGQGAFSPDGRWVVYSSSPSHELFVQAFPISGPRKQISAGGGSMPCWRGDGREIVYLGPDSWVYSVHADPAHGEYHTPERLFAVRTAPNSSTHLTLAVTRDGSRILFNQAIDQPESRVINVAFIGK